MRIIRPSLAVAVALFATSSVFSQTSSNTSASGVSFQARHPDVTETATSDTQRQPTYEYFKVMDGMPMDLELHHDTEVRTGKPIDVYLLVLEKQTMNSDGMREPIGLQFGYFYTAKAMDPATAWNPANAADCKTWVDLTVSALEAHQSWQPTWPYMQFVTAKGARTIDTNEDGTVFWSDDIECWGALDRFQPF
jgi:hypothetical protein